MYTRCEICKTKAKFILSFAMTSNQLKLSGFTGKLNENAMHEKQRENTVVFCYASSLIYLQIIIFIL